MKAATLFYLITILPLFSFCQGIGSVLLGPTNYKISLGDELIVGLPAGSDNRFLFISSDTTKAPAAPESFAETITDSRAIESGSIEELMKNPALQYRDKDVDASPLGAIWIRGEDPLTSKALRIVRFDHYMDNEGRRRSFAIGKTAANERFRIELERAIYSGELSTHNNKMFEDFVVRTGILVRVE